MPSLRTLACNGFLARHQTKSMAATAQEREEICGKALSDLLAKMATGFPAPEYKPEGMGDIAICEGPTPTCGLHGPRTVALAACRRCIGFRAMYGNTAPCHRGNTTGLSVPCAICTTVQLFTIDSCLAFTRRWPFAISTPPRENCGLTMWWTTGLGPLTTTSTMRHVSASHNLYMTDFDGTTAPKPQEVVVLHQHHVLLGVSKLRG